MDETDVASAAEHLVRELRPRIHRYALARLGDPHTAEDVTQETCLAVVRALPTFEDRGAGVTAFVFAVAANKVVDARRRAARVPVPVEDAGLLDRTEEAAGPEELAVRAAQVRALAEPLGALSDRDREIVLLRVVAQLSAEEVGGSLGMSPGAVRVAQHRALRVLRTRLEEEAAP